MALTTNLISFWEFEEASGSRVDQPGTNDLFPSGTPLPGNAAGLVGNAATLTLTAQQYFSIVSNTDVQCGDIDFTFAGWIYGNTLTGTYLVCKDNGTNRDYYFYFDSTAAQFAVFIAGPTAKAATVSDTYATTTWHFLVGWHDAAANTVNCQVNNGTVVSTPTTASLQAATTADFDVGVYGDYASGFADGMIDQLGFWKRVLTTDERAWLYNSGAGRSYAEIVAGMGSQVKLWEMQDIYR
jgi:hypothetical protein